MLAMFGILAIYGLMDDSGVTAAENAGDLAGNVEGHAGGERSAPSEDAASPAARGVATPASTPAGITRLRSRTVVDESGFGQPVQAVSVLVPEGWTFESRVVWAGENGFCSGDHAGVFWSMSSPDGERAIQALPAILISNWPDTFQARALNPGGGHCFLGLFQSSRELAEQVLVPILRPGNRILEVEEISEVPDALRAQVEAQVHTNTMIGGRISAAGTAVLTRTADGRHDEGIISYHVTMDFPSPGFGIPGHRLAMTTTPFVLRAPVGELETLTPLAGTIGETIRVNPGWQRAIQAIENDLIRMQVRGAAERSQILANSFREVGEIQMSGWQNRMDANWRGTQQFSSAIMGVHQRIDPFTGQTIALDDAGRRFFANPAGEYLIVDAPDVDPGQLFPSENWQEMASATAAP